jgi:6-phosphogluconolactonase
MNLTGHHGNALRALLAIVILASACGTSDAPATAPPPADGAHPFVYVGNEGGITWYSLDPGKLAMDKRDSLALGLTAAFMTRSADNKNLYALLRTIDETMPPLQGFLASYAVDQQTGALKEIARVDAQGDRPTYITIDRTGRHILVANNLGHLHGNSVVVFPRNPDGTAGEAKQKLMTGIRAHQIRVHPSNRWVYVPNIDSDTISQFLFDEETGTLTPNTPPTVSVAPVPLPAEPRPPAGPGMPAMGYTGPRHLDFHPNGKWVYLSNEYAATVIAFTINDNGTLTPFQTISGLPPDYTGRKWQSEIRVAPSGKFLYVGERSHESIATFVVNQQDGTLTRAGNTGTLGKTPRNFALTPDGRWMVVGNQGLGMDPGSLVLYTVNPDNGSLLVVFGPAPLPTPYVHLFMMLP